MNREDFVTIDQERFLTRDEAMEYLMLDGDLWVPCSRYGRNTSECAPVAIRVAEIFADSAGDGITLDGLEGAMSLVVNDSDDIADLLADDRAVAREELRRAVRQYGEGLLTDTEFHEVELGLMAQGYSREELDAMG